MVNFFNLKISTNKYVIIVHNNFASVNFANNSGQN